MLTACLITQVAEMLGKIFQAKLTQRGDGPRSVAIEGEFPFLNNTNPETTAHVQRIIPGLAESGFEIHSQEGIDGQPIYEACRDNNVVGNDAGFGTMEIGTRPCISLRELKNVFEQIMGHVLPLADRQGYSVLGSGCHPILHPGRHLVLPKARYGFLWRAFPKKAINWMSVTAALQCHVDCRGIQELITASKVFNAVSPWMTALFANCAVYKQRPGRLKAMRQNVYRAVFPPERAGILQHPNGRWIESLEEWAELMLRQKLLFYCQGQEECFYNHPFRQRVSENGLNETDVLIQEGTIWPDARLRCVFGTLEFRVPCAQLPGEEMTVPALCLGIMENLQIANTLVDHLKITPAHAEYFRSVAVQHGMNWPHKGYLEKGLQPLLAIAYSGLKSRNLGEEAFLEPLFERFKARRCPADEAITAFNKGGLAAVIKKTAWKVS